MRLGDVVDQFHDQNGLANPGTTKQANFAALGIRRQQVDHFDARNQQFGLGRLLDKFRRFLVNGARLLRPDGPASSIGSPITLMMRPSVFSPTGTEMAAPVSTTACRAQDLRLNPWRWYARALAQMLGNFENQTLPPLSVSSAFRISGKAPSN